MDSTGGERRAVWLLLVAYGGLRLIGLLRAVVLEDHDSLGYLRDAAAWATLDPARLAALSPDSTPMFPALTALLGAFLPSAELAGRAVSFLASLGLFAAVLVVGRRIVGPVATLVALALLAVNPVMLGLSFAVLSEPLYVALVFGGFALRLARPGGPRRASLIGLVFGAAFLTRTEGLIFIGAIPLLHVILERVERREIGLRVQAVWVAAFAAGFLAAAVPQIVAVSTKLGSPAINGRVVWMAMMNVDDGRSTDARVYGLDHSPTEINLHYLQRHPEAVEALAGKSDPGDVVRIVLANTVELVRRGGALLVGWPVVLAAIAGGLLVLRDARRRAGPFWIVGALLGTGLLGPLLYNVATRHVAIVAPVLLLLAGAAVAEFGRRRPGALLPIAGLLVVATVTLDARELAGPIVSPPRSTHEYAPATLAEPAALIRGQADGAAARICSRKDYLAWEAGGVRVPLPYTDYPGLLRFMDGNDVELLFVNARLTRRFPFAERLASDPPPAELELLWSGRGARDEALRLYRRRGAP